MSIIPINDGHINTTLRVDINDNDTQQYILQKINHHIFRKPEVIMHSIDVVNKHLQSAGYEYEILETVPNLEGEFLTIDDNKDYWRMTKFIPNTYCVTKVKDRNQAYERENAECLLF